MSSWVIVEEARAEHDAHGRGDEQRTDLASGDANSGSDADGREVSILDDLAADIAANGLLHPIVLDADGQLIDGRNRLAACQRAGVEPTYTTLAAGLDPIGFILSSNVERRNMSQGQTAAVIAKASKLTKDLSLRELANNRRLNRELVRMAAVVVHAEAHPELCHQVRDGTV